MQKQNPVTATGPLPAPDGGTGEMLWRVSYKSSWYDSDPRGSGDVAVGAVAHVLARTRDEAVAKASSLPAFKKARKDRDRGAEETTDVRVATLEDLVAAEKSPGRPGFWTNPLRPVALEHPDDTGRWKLAVCLLPFDPEK
jgi:hypothetical protein